MRSHQENPLSKKHGNYVWLCLFICLCFSCSEVNTHADSSHIEFVLDSAYTNYYKSDSLQQVRGYPLPRLYLNLRISNPTKDTLCLFFKKAMDTLGSQGCIVSISKDGHDTLKYVSWGAGSVVDKEVKILPYSEHLLGVESKLGGVRKNFSALKKQDRIKYLEYLAYETNFEYISDSIHHCRYHPIKSSRISKKTSFKLSYMDDAVIDIE